MYKVLIGDDDPHVIEILEIYLKKEGYEVLRAYNGKEVVETAKRHQPHLIVLDLMMPVMDGLEACRQLRAYSKVPIIMLTAKGEEVDKVLGLEMGADDYVTKPFSPREVVARIKAVLRRLEDPDRLIKDGITLLTVHNLTVDMENYNVHLDGHTISCTPKEIELLFHLMKRPGRVFKREELLAHIWGYDYFGDARTVDTHIKRLRRKLAVPADSLWDIVTVWGAGYKFERK